MTVPADVLAQLRFFVGTWRGRGKGDYPTIQPFEYEEEIVFEDVAKPFLVYRQRTWDVDGKPLHTESGYLRPAGIDAAEFIVAQPTGITEIHAGPLAGQSLRLSSHTVGVSPTAKMVRAVVRTFTVTGNTLTYRLDMEAVDQTLQFHLEAELART